MVVSLWVLLIILINWQDTLTIITAVIVIVMIIFGVTIISLTIFLMAYG